MFNIEEELASAGQAGSIYNEGRDRNRNLWGKAVVLKNRSGSIFRTAAISPRRSGRWWSHRPLLNI